VVTDICLTGQEKPASIARAEYFLQRDYGLVLRKGKFMSPQAIRFVGKLQETYLENVLQSRNKRCE